MKDSRESRLTNGELQRDLQEVFRRRHWAEPQDDQQEFDDTLNSSTRSGPMSVEKALEKFDARFSEKPATRPPRYWTHPSVLALQEADPIAAITSRARRLVLQAMEAGWNGPPYDPFALAEYLGIRIVPTEDV